MSETLTRRAPLEPATADPEAMTVRVTWMTGAAVARRDARGPFREVLSIAPGAVDLSRFISAPVLNAHRQGDIADVLGVVTDAGIADGAGWAVIRVSERHRGVFADIRAGILRQVSIGYAVETWREDIDPATGERTRTAVRWAPHELSFVPVAADPGATTRAGVNPMPDSIETQTAAPAETRAHINTEIRSIARLAGLSRDFSDGLIDRGATVVEARAAAFDELARQPETRTARVEVGHSYDDPRTRAAVIGEALYTRLDPTHERRRPLAPTSDIRPSTWPATAFSGPARR